MKNLFQIVMHIWTNNSLDRETGLSPSPIEVRWPETTGRGHEESTKLWTCVYFLSMVDFYEMSAAVLQLLAGICIEKSRQHFSCAST